MNEDVRFNGQNVSNSLAEPRPVCQSRLLVGFTNRKNIHKTLALGHLCLACLAISILWAKEGQKKSYITGQLSYTAFELPACGRLYFVTFFHNQGKNLATVDMFGQAP